MRVRIEHASNPLNYGTSMMVINFIHYLNKYCNRSFQITLDVADRESLDIYKKQFPKMDLKKYYIDYNFINSKSIYDKIKNKIKREILFKIYNKRNMEMLVSSTDLLVILGGDDLSEYYGIDNLNRELDRIEYIKNKLTVYLIGQTIGPFNILNKDDIRKKIGDTIIYSRDKWTTNYLENILGFKKVFNGQDLALLDLPYQNDVLKEENILSKYKLIKKKYMVIIPSGLYKNYCNDEILYINNWIKILENIMKSYPEYKVIIFPHVLSPKEVDDRLIIKKIEEGVKGINNIEFIYDAMESVEARFILGNSKVSISGRMHGAISTLQMETPAIALSYSIKYKAVIGENIGLEELVVDATSYDSWGKYEISTAVNKKLKFIMDNYDDITSEIKGKVNLAKKNVDKMMKELSVFIEDRKI